MAEKTIKIKFRTDYSPRKNGDVVELETKLANHYLSIGVAEIPCTDCKEKPCSDCEKLAKVEVVSEAETEVKETVVTTKKTTKK